MYFISLRYTQYKIHVMYQLRRCWENSKLLPSQCWPCCWWGEKFLLWLRCQNFFGHPGVPSLGWWTSWKRQACKVQALSGGAGGPGWFISKRWRCPYFCSWFAGVGCGRSSTSNRPIEPWQLCQSGYCNWCLWLLNVKSKGAFDCRPIQLDHGATRKPHLHLNSSWWFWKRSFFLPSMWYCWNTVHFSTHPKKIPQFFISLSLFISA
jgi:hypothetical protein